MSARLSSLFLKAAIVLAATGTAAGAGSLDEDHRSFQAFKTENTVGKPLVIEPEHCAFHGCFWRNAFVLYTIKKLLIDAGHGKTYDTDPRTHVASAKLMPWVLKERNVEIFLNAGQVTAAEVEYFYTTEEANCPYEAQTNFTVTNNGQPNPIADITRAVFRVENEDKSGESYHVTMRECVEKDGDGWKQIRWGWFLKG